MKRINIFLILIIATLSTLFGTAQSHDWLIYDGKFLRIATDPLETYPWPEDNRPWFETFPGSHSTANYRGYLAIWEVRESKLFLAGLDCFVEKPEEEWEEPEPDENGVTTWSIHDHKVRVDLKKLFSKRFDSNRVFADWFSGTVRIPEGKILKYIHAGHASIFERDILLHFENGILIKSEVRKNEVPKTNQEKAEQVDRHQSI